MDESPHWILSFINTPFPLLGVLASIIGYLAIHSLNSISRKFDSLERKIDSSIAKLDSTIEKMDSKIEKLDSKIEKQNDAILQNSQRISMIEGYLWSDLNKNRNLDR